MPQSGKLPVLNVLTGQKFSSRRRPLPGSAEPPKFNELEMVTAFTYKPSLARIDARNFELTMTMTMILLHIVARRLNR